MQENWFEMCLDLPDIRDRGEQYQVDAFSDQPFGGNPAAVVFEHRDPMWMQRVAAENNLSETAFIKLRPGTIADFDIKWYDFQNFQTIQFFSIDTDRIFTRIQNRFTPSQEVDLCGHATLASAHAIYESGRVPSRQTPIKFYSSSGEILSANSKSDGMIELNFPSTPPSPLILSETEVTNLLEGLSIELTHVIYMGCTIYDFFFEISIVAFNSLKNIDFQALHKLGRRGIIITCQSDNCSHDFTSRWFGPRYVCVNRFIAVDENKSKNGCRNA